MAPLPNPPTVDLQNPFYCPSISASAYIHNLHKSATEKLLNPFVRVLARALDTPSNNPGDKGIQDSDSDASGSSLGSSTNTTASCHSAPGPENRQSHTAPGRPQIPTISVIGTRGAATKTGNATTSIIASNGVPHINNSLASQAQIPAGPFNRLRDSRLLARPPRKRKERHGSSDAESEDNNLKGPSKHAKSLPATEQKSFQVRLKREQLNFNVASSQNLVASCLSSASPQSFALPPSSQGSPKSKKSPEQMGESEMMWKEIQEVAPELRMPSFTLTHPSSVVSHLAENGLLTAPLMRVIGKYACISELSLSPSICEHNGLNLGRAAEILPELHSPGLFKNVTRLTCSGVPLADSVALYFHHLPLQVLDLRKTRIGNAAVFMLVSHKDTLCQLLINCNRAINDDAIPALLLLRGLSYLSIYGTRITMAGLRRYARKVNKENRSVRVEMPRSCREYIDREMRNEYLLAINPPLLSIPEHCTRVSSAELKKNLLAHSVVNRKITISGSKSDLVGRLFWLLEQRETDLLVKKMLENSRSRGEAEVVSEYDDDGENWSDDEE